MEKTNLKHKKNISSVPIQNQSKNELEFCVEQLIKQCKNETTIEKVIAIGIELETIYTEIDKRQLEEEISELEDELKEVQKELAKYK